MNWHILTYSLQTWQINTSELFFSFIMVRTRLTSSKSLSWTGKMLYRIFEIVQHLKSFFSAMTNILAISIFWSTSIHLLLVNCISRFKNDVRFIFTSGRLMSCLRYLCLFAYIVVSNTLCGFFSPSCTLCCQFLWIVHFWLPLQCSLMFIYVEVFIHATH